MKYRKKPVIIEAFRFGFDKTPLWFDKELMEDGKIGLIVSCEVENDYCTIKTLEGTMKGNYGDYIIKGVKNEIYPCKADIFEATYEKLKKGDK